MWFRRARERRAARERFSAVADKIGARDGHVLSERFFGSLVVPYGLSFTVIRPGPAAEVARAQLAAAVAAGYTGSPVPPCGSTRPCVFTTPAELPMLWIETFPAGSTIRGTSTVIPAGFTGIVISIG